MVDVASYIEGNNVQREKIALDIKRGRLDDSDIDALIADERIQAAFVGNVYADKRPQSQWTQDYLDELPYAAVAEAFNEDYLRYLREVTVHFGNAKGKRISKGIVIGAVVVLAVAAVVAWMLISRTAPSQESAMQGTNL